MRKQTPQTLLLLVVSLFAVQLTFADYCTPTNTPSGTIPINSFTLTDDESSQQIDVDDASAVNGTVYYDKTDVVFTTSAGATVTPTFDIVTYGQGQLYVDFNGDEEFVSNIGDDGKPEYDSELIAYTGVPLSTIIYSNHLGETGSTPTSNLQTFPAFVMPRNAPPGEFRARMMVSSSILPDDPCGEDYRFTLWGVGIMIDFTIKIPQIAERTVTVEVNNPLLGTAETTTTSDGLVVCTAEINELGEFVNWTDEDGVEISDELTYYDYIGGDHTVTANFTQLNTVTITYGENGTVSPIGTYILTVYDSKTITITPNNGCDLDKLMLNDQDVSADAVKSFTLSSSRPITYTYTIKNINSISTLHATFAEVCTGEVLTYPYEYDFFDSDPLVCWSVIDKSSTSYSWEYSSYGYVYLASSANANDWLITPRVMIENGMEATFRGYKSGTGAAPVAVYVMSSPSDYANADKVAEGEFGDVIENLDANLSKYLGEELYVGLNVLSSETTARIIVCDFYLTIPNYTITVVTNGEGTATVNGEESVEVEVDDELVFEAVAAEYYTFSNWTYEDGSSISSKNPYTRYANQSLVITANFILETPREVSIKANVADRGVQTIVSPSTTETSIVSDLPVTVKTESTNATDYTFENWTDAEGNIISTQQEFTYYGVDAIELTANYSAVVTVTLEYGIGGTMVVTHNGVTVSGSCRAAEFDILNIELTPSTGREVSGLLVNGVDVLAGSEYDATTGYNLQITATTTIQPVFGYLPVMLTYSSTGGGYIEVWSAESYNSDGTSSPSGEQFISGYEVPSNSPLYIFPYAEGEKIVSSVLINGVEYVSDITEYGYSSVEYVPTANTIVEAVFSYPTGIEDLTASSNAKVYGARGCIVIEPQTDAQTVQQAEIYNVAGVRVAELYVTERIEIEQPIGIYIVRVGEYSYKVAVR